MERDTLPSIGIVFAQFAAYHVDRCEAAAAALAGRYRVLAVEVATRSQAYAWEPSGTVAGAEKVTLFPGRELEAVDWTHRLRAEFAVLRGCRHVFIGLPYSLPDAIVLSWLLRFSGVAVTVMSESKFDDRARPAWRETGKRVLLRSYTSAIVGGRRHMAYMRHLGFRDRRVLPGYDGVGVERIRRQAAGAPPLAWEARPFVYVGRFDPKKNLPGLLRGYARYCAQVAEPRRLRVVGDGAMRPHLERLSEELGIAGRVEWPGFLGAEAVSRELANALALCLVSTEEQWGLVVNEAAALAVPAIVSHSVGSRDALVRDGVNGFVIDPGDTETIARAMAALGHERALWERMAARTAERAWMGDSARFADAIELTLDPGAAAAGERMAGFERELSLDEVGGTSA